MEVNFPVSSESIVKAKSKAAKYAEKADISNQKNKDSFQKSVDDFLSERSCKDIQQMRRQRREEIKREQQQAYEYRLARRRKLKLLIKKHEDYVRFLEETALKKSMNERERIKSPDSTEAEINAVTNAVTDAKQPLFIKVK